MDTAKEKQSIKQGQKSKGEKVVETCFLVATWIALGLYLEIFGPTLIDLKQKLNTDYESITVAISARCVGTFPGSVFGGIVVDKFGNYSHLVLAICLDIAALTTAAIPWFPNLMVLWILCFLGGFTESMINIAGQHLILKLWTEKAATPMILLHSGYGLGSFIISLLSNQFLAKRREVHQNVTCATEEFTGINDTLLSFANTNGTVNSTETVRFTESKIEYAFAITAAIVIVHSISFYIYQIRERKCGYRNGESVDFESEMSEKSKIENKNGSLLQLINPASCTGGRFWYGVEIFFLVVLFSANAVGGERLVGGFVRTFAVEKLKFTSDEASYINTSFWISFTVGRISFSVLAKWMKISTVLLCQALGMLGVSVLLSFVVELNVNAYWILMQPLAVFLAPMWPTCYAWTDYHLELTGIGMTLIILGGSVGGTCHLRLIGYLYVHAGKYAFLYQVLGCGILACVLALLLNLAGSQHGSRFDWHKADKQTSDVIERGETAQEKKESGANEYIKADINNLTKL